MTARTYLGHGNKITPQSEPIPGTDQVPNSSGGYSFAVDDWTRLERFLVLGSEGGSYYATERILTRENAKAVERCIQADGERTVRIIESISVGGRAPKNDPALFALAMAISYGDKTTKAHAAKALPFVARTGTHLLHFVSYVDQFRGWGRGLRKAIADWYLSKTAKDLAYQLVKYQSRDKWSHRDLLRLSHPKATGSLNDVLHWSVKGWPGIGPDVPPDEALRLIWAFEKAKTADTAQILSLIRMFRLPREGVPTEKMTDKDVWQALLDEPMPMTAMIRNLATMTRVGLLGDLLPATSQVTSQLQNAERLKRARVHPVQILAAMLTYQAGHGARSNATWSPVRKIVDALDAAFYLSFGAVEPTNKRIVLALDVSGSMTMGTIAGVPGLTPRVGAAAMALVTAAVEPNYTTIAFTASSGGGYMLNRSDLDGISVLPISPRQRLDDVVKLTDDLPFGGTDCALPMLWALKHNVQADAFVIYTDSETWHGAIHPVQALKEYRAKTGIPAKLVVVGMVSNGFSLADPNDAGMLDVCGFDLATPNVISQFIGG